MPGFELIGSRELHEVQKVFESGAIMSRFGFDGRRNGCFMVQKFEEEFARQNQSNHALAVSSGTAALRVALASLNIGYGDEVITQCFTFVATAEAIIECGATPVIANIDATLNIDPTELELLITPKTKAVILVHMLGSPGYIKDVRDICARRGIFLIEDTAWGCGGSLQETKLGNWGDIGTYSFDFAKTITTGEGGMLVFKDQVHWENAKAWHDHGHENNPHVPRWEDTRKSSGFNFRMMELQGALGIAQLSRLEGIIRDQRKIHDEIWESIQDLDGLEGREFPEGSAATCDGLIFFCPSQRVARNCRSQLLKAGISTKILPEAMSWHFAGLWEHMPSLKSHAGKSVRESLQPSERLLARAVCLPITLTDGAKHAKEIRKAIRLAFNERVS